MIQSRDDSVGITDVSFFFLNVCDMIDISCLIKSSNIHPHKLPRHVAGLMHLS